MTAWKQKILDAFISRYIASAPDTELENREERAILRLRSVSIFPGFEAALPDEKESYLEAAEGLEQKGLLRLNWEKRGKGERLKTLSCENFEKLFEEAGGPHPKTEAEKICAMLADKVSTLKKSFANVGGNALDGEAAREAEKAAALLDYFSRNFGVREIGQGISYPIMEDIVRLLETFFEPAKLENISPRALSILLYRDSKRLEQLLSLCGRFLARAQKTVPCPDFAFLERSYPETFISGKIIIEYKTGAPPIVNTDGLILGLPLKSAEAVGAIQTITAKKEKMALTIENKETFYALGSPQKHGASEMLSRYDCFLYTGGYPNRAAAALIKALASSGFVLHHAGDLDPDGVLILQQVGDIAECPVVPVQMNAVVFDKYRPWARTLAKPMLAQIEKIRAETRALPGIAGLLRRIQETGLGVEQEIIDYRG